MRTFLAIDLPDEVEAAIARLQQPLRELPGIKLSRPEQCHLTLKFLGEIDESRADELRVALREVRHATFELRLTRLGVFPDTRRPRVIWLGVSESVELQALARSVDQATNVIALDKPFVAHLTLARIKESRAPLASDVLAAAAPPCAFTVRDFVLFRSLLGREGALHEVIERFPLAGS